MADEMPKIERDGTVRTFRTQTVSVHHFRRTARKRERWLTQALNARWEVAQYEMRGMEQFELWLAQLGLPYWARGFRVEHAGPFSFVVVATERQGH